MAEFIFVPKNCESTNSMYFSEVQLMFLNMLIHGLDFHGVPEER